MNHKFLKIVLILCVSNSFVFAQKKPSKNPDTKRGMLSFGINYSDYGFIKMAKDSSISAAFNRKGLFKSGNSSFGFGISYWKGLGSHIDFTTNFTGTFSNFPALFVKEDSIGRASFTPQLDMLLHVKALKDNRLINPFLTGGIGAGYFGKKLAVYAPVGTGLQFHFKQGAFLFIQAQWRLALTDGIRDDYMFYAVGFAQQKINAKKTKKLPETKPLPVIDTPKKVNPAETDTDGDGFPDLRDNCPAVKGIIMGCPDSDGDGIADKDDQCVDVKGVARYKGCPVPDTDGDGVNDEDDNCRTEAGLKENNGCPAKKTEPAESKDNDGDGIANKDDKCPDAAGSAANNGCPIQLVEGAKLLRSSGDSMTYFIRFDLDRSNITAEAFEVLNQVVKLLKSDRSLFVNIEGHADNFGQEKYNMMISSDRANIAKDYLVSYNVAKNRITTAYYGSAKPYDINQPWLNRRVELTIFKKK